MVCVVVNPEICMSENPQTKDTADELSPLTANQKAIWLEQKLYPDSPLYNIGGYSIIEGEINEEAFKNAATILVCETDALRIRTREIDGQAFQEFVDVPGYEIPILDFSEDKDSYQEAMSWMKSDFGEPISLSQKELFVFRLIKLNTQHYIWYTKFHHIIIDGFGISLFANRQAEIYNEILTGEEQPTKGYYSYETYVEFDAQYRKSASFDQDMAYWMGKFETLPEPLVPDLKNVSIEGTPPKETVRISRSLFDKLVLLCTDQRVSVFHYFLAVLYVYFSKFYQKKDWVIGLPILNRSSFKHKRTIGMFTGNIPLRLDTPDDNTLVGLMRLIRSELSESYRYQKFPFDELTRAINLIGKDRQRLFDISFSYEKHTYAMTFDGAPTKTIPLSGGTGFDPLAVFVREFEDDEWIDIDFSYSPAYFKQSEVSRMISHFKYLVENLSKDLNQEIQDISILPEREKKNLLLDFNKTEVTYGKDKTIVQLFEEQVIKTSDAIAVVFKESQLTYSEVNAKANALAHFLIENESIEKGKIVGVLQERSEWMLVSILGILKAGAAYLPIDPDYPEERVRYVIEDSGTSIVLSEEKFTYHKEQDSKVSIIDVRTVSHANTDNPVLSADPDDLAYVIYTSGSTGKPKGVMVEHGNVVNFFAGIDNKIPVSNSQNTLLAVTTISFDISVLELLWTLTSGFKVVIKPSQNQNSSRDTKALSTRKVDFSLFYFASEVDVENKYRLLLEGARFADENGFSAVWTPERHFHEFGGIYPNPSVTGAAIATITENIQIRSGSCVLPIHNPIRVVEEWSVVDNLSDGRVGMSFASGWVQNDFLAFSPNGFDVRKQTMQDGIETVKKLWAGESIQLENPNGPDAKVKIYPQPIQPELPIWVTAAGSPETFRMAGDSGAYLLTHLLGQTIEELGEKIAIYRAARKEAGYIGEGHVTLMIHTFVDEDIERVREEVRAPFRNYIKSSTGLMRMVAKSMGQDPDTLKGENLEALLDHAYNRYFDTAALFGTPDSCLEMVNKLSLIGVNELGCLIDFGIDANSTLEGLRHLNALKNNYHHQITEPKEEFTATDLIKQHEVSHLQCTPSTLKMLLMESGAEAKMGSLSCLMVGGEPLPKYLTDSVHERLDVKLFNMYGPTETTIWSSISEVLPDQGINIGKPIANTSIYLLDESLMPVPVGAIGNIYIGGDGVTRGYINQPELTADRFVSNPFSKKGKIYKTGDKGRWLEDGNIEFLGRDDEQVKVRGYRIETGEIEYRLNNHPDVDEAAVTIAKNEEQGDTELVACIVCRGGNPDLVSLTDFLQQGLPAYMVPSRFMVLEELPLTPNGKVDKRGMLGQAGLQLSSEATYIDPRTETEEQLAQIWKDLLNTDRVGAKDHFFRMGGHSLTAMRMVSRIQHDLGFEVALRDIFEYPTLEALAAQLANKAFAGYEFLEPLPNQDFYPVSHAQRRLWVLDKLDEEHIAYNMPAAFSMKGSLDIPSLHKAIIAVVHRHESLRTSFRTENETPVQVIHSEIDFKLIVHDLSKETNRSDQANKIITEDAIAAFDLSKPELLRLQVIKLEETDFILVFNMHHIISDGWSTNILIEELMHFYHDFLNGKEPDLKALDIHYKEYCNWENKLLQSDIGHELKKYWTDTLSGELPILKLPGDRPRPRVKTHKGGRISHQLDIELVNQLKQLSLNHESSLYMTLIAVLNVLLHRYSGQNDIIIGTSTAGRQHPEFEKLMGFCVNTLPIRNKVDQKSGFDSLLSKVKKSVTGAFQHQLYPFDSLVDDLDTERDMSRHAIFDVIAIVNNHEQTQLDLDEIEITPIHNPNPVSKFDLGFYFDENSEGLNISVVYNAHLFDYERIARMLSHFEQLCTSAVLSPSALVEDLDMLPKEEKGLLDSFSDDVDSAFSNINCDVIELFEKQVAASPNAIAIRCHGYEMTYEELNQNANRLANGLLALDNINTNSVVGLLVERNELMVVGMIGILKARCIYLPLVSSLPKSRINNILNDANCELILSSENLLSTIEGLEVKSKDIAKVQSNEPTNPGISIPQSDMAYIVFTSGSTGTPKGIKGTYSGLGNYISFLHDKVSLNESDHVLQLASLNFDASFRDIMAPLTAGASISILNDQDPEKMVGLILNSQVTCLLSIVPSVFNVLLKEWEEQGETDHLLRLVILSGERLSQKLSAKARELLGSEVRLFNFYGPSECTMTTTFFELPDTLNDLDEIPVGRPIPNTEVIILNGNERVPVGVPGQICIGGVGLTHGYLGDKTLTESAFIEHPFRSGQKTYKTGDLGYWLLDGNIALMGRIDDQLKIRGVRIEPGEIEQHLLSFSGVSNALVLAIDNSKGDKELIAFILSRVRFDVKEMRSHLQKQLPEYMVPGRLIRVEEFPLTPNGKVDRQELEELSKHELSNEDSNEAPRNELERALQKIWIDILGYSEISIHDNFFASGGHSLSAIKMAARIHKVMGVEVSLKEIFGCPTIAELCATFVDKTQTDFVKIKRVEKAEHYALSHAQYRLWVLSQFAESSSAYNIVKALKVSGGLDIEILDRALLTLVMRHETLRTRFVTIEGEPVQVVEDQIETSIELQDLSLQKDQKQSIADIIRQEELTPFDLDTAPLLRLRLLQLDAGEYVLILNMHHIISDGWSMTILARELMTLYHDFYDEQTPVLSELSIQYKDYCVWQNELLAGAKAKGLREYWFKKLAGKLPVLQLPLDHPRPKVKSYKGSTLARTFEVELTAEFHEFARRNDCTLFMVLMATVKVLLYQYSKQTDIIVGTPVAGRKHNDLEGLIGMFVNTLAIRSDIDTDECFESFLVQVKNNMTEAFQHEEYPFDCLIDELQVTRDLSRYPLFDIMVAMNNNDNVDLSSETLSFGTVPVSNSTSKFDLGFFFTEVDGSLKLSLDYSTDLFDSSSIEFILQHFEQLSNEILKRPETKIGRLNLLSDTEEQLLLEEFNDTNVDYPEGHTLISLFEEQVLQTPDAVSLVFGDGQLTYGELNARVNHLARYILETFSPSKDNIIPVVVERNEWMLISLLGIMKCGAAYLPIDTACPPERLKFLIEDSGAKLLLTDQKVGELPHSISDFEVVFIPEVSHEDSSNPKSNVTPDELAYVIYTSGSTGNPKGVMIEHQSIVNRLQWMQQEFAIGGDEVFLQKTPYTFDVSVWELFLPVVTGAKLCLLPPGAEKSPDVISNHIADYGVTNIHFVPSMLEAFLHFCKANAENINLQTLKRVFASGEALAKHHVSDFELLINEPFNVSLINKYGPTEAAVDVSFFDCSLSNNYQNVPIGKPIGNVRLHVLNDTDNLQGIGVPGELCIGGVALGRGYLNRPELTKEKFFNHSVENGGRLYRTGDLARWLPDGQIEYLGRIDDQVKIRGYRIEPGEIEHVLLKHQEIEECVVLPVLEKNKQYELTAFIVTNNPELHSTELRNYLNKHLPDYMVPGNYISISSVPVTSNGKADKKTLLEEQKRGALLGSGVEYVAPVTTTEIKLAAIWSELLNRDQVGTRDNFFNLGGHSLKATRMVAHIHREFNCEILLRQIFEYPEMGQLATEIDNTLWLQESEHNIEANNNTYTTTL